MPLEQELGLKKGFETGEHEALLNIYYTASLLKKKADVFFHQFGLTDVQFNVIMLLAYQGGSQQGLSQAQLSDMMLVNRANITSLVDRMEKAGLVTRTAEPDDRRYNIVKMTTKGKKIFAKVEPSYLEQVRKIMASLDTPELKKLMTMLEKVRRTLRI